LSVTHNTNKNMNNQLTNIINLRSLAKSNGVKVHTPENLNFALIGGFISFYMINEGKLVPTYEIKNFMNLSYGRVLQLLNAMAVDNILKKYYDGTSCYWEIKL